MTQKDRYKFPLALKCQKNRQNVKLATELCTLAHCINSVKNYKPGDDTQEALNLAEVPKTVWFDINY